MKVIDLSHLICPHMPVYPGDRRPEIEKVLTLQTSIVNTSFFAMSSHTGTHIDCPSHVLDTALCTDNQPLSHFMGKGLVLDCSRYKQETLITTDVLASKNLKGIEYLLFYTGWAKLWESEKYLKYPVFSRELSEVLADSPLKGIGVDTISIDPSDDLILANHKTLLTKQKVIVENLTNLDKLIDQTFLFIALPLKLKAGDGSPVRAVALIE